MYTLSMEEVTIIVGGEPALLPKEVAEALGSRPRAVLAAFGEALHSGQSKLTVNLYNGRIQFAGAEEPQWDGWYTRYTLRNDAITGWSIFDHATGRCYNEEDLGNLPAFLLGQVVPQWGDSPAALHAARAEVEEHVLYLDMDELDAALAARH